MQESAGFSVPFILRTSEALVLIVPNCHKIQLAIKNKMFGWFCSFGCLGYVLIAARTLCSLCNKVCMRLLLCCIFVNESKDMECVALFLYILINIHTELIRLHNVRNGLYFQ